VQYLEKKSFISIEDETTNEYHEKNGEDFIEYILNGLTKKQARDRYNDS
jgi:hypothetical protein